MKSNLITLCSVCCALLCENVLAEAGNKPEISKELSIKKFNFKDAQQVSSDRYKKSRELAPKWFAAAESGDLEAMKSVYEDPFFDNTYGFKFDIYVENDDGKTALEVAITNGRCNVVKWLDSIIQKYEKEMGGHRFNLGSSNADGTPMIIIAVENGHEDIVKYMLSKVMDPNIAIDMKKMSRKTPLIVAVEKGLIEIANLLLTNPYSRKANPNLQDRFGKTALIYATEKGNFEIVELLLKHDADTEIKDRYKVTALMYAVESGNLAIAKLLLDHGAKINRTGENKKTVLDYAEGNKEMTELLMKYIDRPENQKKVNIFKRTLNKFTRKTGDPRMTMSDSNLTKYDTDKTSGLTRSQSDSNVTQYDDITEEASNLKKSESVDSDTTFHNDDMQTSQDIDDMNSSTDTIAAQ